MIRRPGPFSVGLRGLIYDRPWVRDVDAASALAGYQEALEHGLAKDRVIIVRRPGTGAELKPEDYPWDVRKT